jgi:hypothetical protein
LHLILTSIFSSISEDLNRFALGAFEVEQVYITQGLNPESPIYLIGNGAAIVGLLGVGIHCSRGWVIENAQSSSVANPENTLTDETTEVVDPFLSINAEKGSAAWTEGQLKWLEQESLNAFWNVKLKESTRGSIWTEDQLRRLEQESPNVFWAVKLKNQI